MGDAIWVPTIRPRAVFFRARKFNAVALVSRMSKSPDRRPDLRPRVVCFATQGSDSGDERRIRALLEPLSATTQPFDRSRKLRSCIGTAARLIRERPDVAVMEGTGVAGGVAVLAAGVAGVRFVVSSGDAVTPFVSSFRPWLRPLAWAYERLLCSRSAGFIGWTPYLAGRALTLTILPCASAM